MALGIVFLAVLTAAPILACVILAGLGGYAVLLLWASTVGGILVLTLVKSFCPIWIGRTNADSDNDLEERQVGKISFRS